MLLVDAGADSVVAGRELYAEAELELEPACDELAAVVPVGELALLLTARFRLGGPLRCRFVWPETRRLLVDCCARWATGVIGRATGPVSRELPTLRCVAVAPEAAPGVDAAAAGVPVWRCGAEVPSTWDAIAITATATATATASVPATTEPTITPNRSPA